MQMCSIFDQFFSWSFWSSSTLPQLVALHCVVLRCCLLRVALCCVVLCCVVLCCDLSLTCYSSLLALKFLSFPVPSLYDSTQQLDGRTTIQPARPTPQLNMQNFHCVFSTGKHRFLHGIFIITTTFLCAFSCPG